MFWKKKNQQVNSKEYEDLAKKLTTLEAELERVSLSFAMYKKKNTKAVQKILDIDSDEIKDFDPYNGVLLPDKQNKK